MQPESKLNYQQQLETAIPSIDQMNADAKQAYKYTQRYLDKQASMYEEKKRKAADDAAKLASINYDQQNDIEAAIEQLKRAITVEVEKKYVTPYELAQRYLQKQANYTLERGKNTDPSKHAQLLDAFKQQVNSSRTQLNKIEAGNSSLWTHIDTLGEDLEIELAEKLKSSVQSIATSTPVEDPIINTTEHEAVKSQSEIEMNEVSVKNLYKRFPMSGRLIRNDTSDDKNTVINDILIFETSAKDSLDSLIVTYTLTKDGQGAKIKITTTQDTNFETELDVKLIPVVKNILKCDRANTITEALTFLKSTQTNTKASRGIMFLLTNLIEATQEELSLTQLQ